MGPFTLLDFVGLDTTYYIANIMFDEYREPAYAPPPLLKRMVLAGRLGRSQGRGSTNTEQRQIGVDVQSSDVQTLGCRLLRQRCQQLAAPWP